MIIKRIPAIPPPPPVKPGDSVLVEYLGRNHARMVVASARVHEPGSKIFSAYVWNSEMRFYSMDDEGKTWCRDQEPAASAFRTVVALREQEE